MDSRSVPGARPMLWPALWIPLLILVVGLITTAVTASLKADQARELADARYRAEHRAIVNRLLANAPTYLDRDTPPASWLPVILGEALPEQLGLRIDTLQRHSKIPILQMQADGELDPTLALRTEIRPGDHHWMLTTVPTSALLGNAARQARSRIWLVGLSLTLAITGLVLAMCRRLHRQQLRNLDLASREQGADQQINNLQVEKSILRQALNDSEARSRDLVALSGALIAELDERGVIGFISAHSANLLGQAPADLAGKTFADLVTPPFRDNFHRTLEAARHDNQAQRIDLHLQVRNRDTPQPVAVRLKALKDPVHGLTGYRLNASPTGPSGT
ncbi:PAS domain-containing protein [Marinobacter pelagius]|uniref:PAS domain-containing protein n=1 Tax=Marinobacter sp. C7 TaxID=2951363 RepID=UPI001EF12AFF|nr:PAS domain-containing protein [Marinobacter sp. C7]MCG7200107.1 PAS domain-containing protein [Marinobacter sp. C7]